MEILLANFSLPYHPQLILQQQKPNQSHSVVEATASDVQSWASAGDTNFSPIATELYNLETAPMLVVLFEPRKLLSSCGVANSSGGRINLELIKFRLIKGSFTAYRTQYFLSIAQTFFLGCPAWISCVLHLAFAHEIAIHSPAQYLGDVTESGFRLPLTIRELLSQGLVAQRNVQK